MPVSYRREMNHNYMIITSTEQEAGGYECKMLSSNTIEGLLKFRVGHFEERNEFYYEITSKQPLDRILNQRPINGHEIRSLLLSIAVTLGKIEDFLLKEEQIMLEPEYIYVDPDHFKVYLCMVPGYCCDFPAAVSALLGYLIGKVNHQDKDGVVLAYNLYHESLKENYGLSDLLGHFSGKGGSIFHMRQPDQQEQAEPAAYVAQEHGRRGIYADQEQGVQGTGVQKTYGAQEIYGAQGEYGAPEEYTAHRECATTVEYATSREAREKENVRAAVKHTQQGDFIKKPNAGENSGFLIKGIKIIALVAAVEILLWIFAGTAELLRYGIFVGALSLLVSISVARNSTNKQKTNKKNMEPKETWQLMPQEKTDKDWTDWIESDNIGECEKTKLTKEPETSLLVAKSDFTHLVLMESLSRERENITISYVPFVIGKHSEMADYCLRQPTVSRLHIRIDQKEGVYIVTDLNSTNGTIVEGYHLQANETVSIKNGDTIYIADAGYRFLNS